MSSVTHELRTPLTSIRALSELMLDTPDMEAAQREEFLRIVVSESERLSRLVNQVLDLAKIESGHAEWHNTDVDMRALVADAVRATSELFRERGAAVDARPARRGAADPRRPRPADPGDAEPALERRQVRARRAAAGSRSRCGADGDGLVVEVRDNGPGVPPDEQATVFEKFRQGGDALTRPPGTGLGLPISRQIVDHFGGRMWLESEPGRGACFAFRLPLRPGGKEHAHEGADRRRRAEHRRVARVHDEARGLRGAGGARRHAGAGDDPPRAAAPGAARRDDAGHDRVRRLRGGARRRRASATPAS